MFDYLTCAKKNLLWYLAFWGKYLVESLYATPLAEAVLAVTPPEAVMMISDGRQ